jgi:dTDP-4-dehydrorhamnose reductase
MTVYVFGVSGMLGNYLRETLNTNGIHLVGFTRDNYDIKECSYQTLYELFETHAIVENDVVVNCAGIIPQKNTDKKLFYVVNAVFPILLSCVANVRRVKLVHITTDCVYDGRVGQYTEHDPHTEQGDYGLSKSLGENIQATIIRTSIIGHERYGKKSLLEWVLSDHLSTGNVIQGYTHHRWNGLTCLELSKFITHIIRNDLLWNGVRHIFSNTVSKYELLCMIRDTYGLHTLTIQPCVTASVDKSLCSVYASSVESFGYEIPPLATQVQELYMHHINNIRHI